MKRPRLSRWTAVLALATALAAGGASAAESDTLTITGVFHTTELQGVVGADLAQVFSNGGEHTWSLTLYGVTISHESFSNTTYKLVKRYTYVHATSFDFQFEGPDADILNAVVSQQLVAGAFSNGAFLWLTNADSNGSQWGEWYLGLSPQDPANGVYFDVENQLSQNVFPSDANGYPIVPSQLVPEEAYILDDRSGNSGYLWSWAPDDVVDLAGSTGTEVPAALGIDDGSVVEGNRGSSKLRLTVWLSNASGQSISVAYRTVNGTAVAKADYTASSGTVTFLPGETAKTITISIKGDRKVEPDETFTVELFNAVGASIEDGVATATILNDD